MNYQSRCALVLTAFILLIHVQAQESPNTPLAPTAPLGDSTAKGYILGPNDQLTMQVADLDDVFGGKTFKVDQGGELSLPLIGRIRAAGLTVGGFEQEIRAHLGGILKNPDVAVNISSSGSQPVAILGAINSPGIRQLDGRKTLFEVLSLAGGLRVDAGYQIRITRSMQWGRIPLANAQTDRTGQFSTATVKVRNILNGAGGDENIPVLPGDNISVPTARQVYILGSVSKPGRILLTEHESIPTLQLVSTAEGFQKTAAPDKARILRSVPGSAQRIDVAVNLKDIFAGKIPDVQLQSEDILFVPNSRAKSAGYRALDLVASPNGVVGIAGRY
jgi:polysaccharide export outer membrane protein